MSPADCLQFVIVLNYFFSTNSLAKQSDRRINSWFLSKNENKGMRVLELKETFGYPRTKSHQQTQKAKNKSCV